MQTNPLGACEHHWELPIGVAVRGKCQYLMGMRIIHVLPIPLQQEQGRECTWEASFSCQKLVCWIKVGLGLMWQEENWTVNSVDILLYNNTTTFPASSIALGVG